MPHDVHPDLEPLIAELVSIDSVNPALDPDHPGETELARFVATWCEGRGLKVEWLESYAPGRPSVIVTAPGTGGGRNVLLYSHLDTVGVKGMPSPFAPRVEGGRMYGRGTIDMKASLAVCMLLLADAAERDLAGDVVLMCVADEEHDSIGTREALAHLARTAKLDAAIVTEVTSMELHVAHRGFALFEVEFEGKESHTSRPADGVNALTHLGRLLAAVERHDEELRRRPPHPLLAHGSLQAVLAAGGQELFTTPSRATATIERRTLPGETAATTLAEMESLLAELTAADPAVKPTVRQVLARSPFEVAPGAEVLELLGAAIAAETGATPARVGAPYWTDAALIADAGIPTVLFGPIGGGIHQLDEWVDLGSVHAVMRILERVVGELAK